MTVADRKEYRLIRADYSAVVLPWPPDSMARDYFPHFFYGCRNRPPGYGATPKGPVGIIPAAMLGPSLAQRFLHGAVVYERVLTREECDGYELTPILPWPGVPSAYEWSLVAQAVVQALALAHCGDCNAGRGEAFDAQWADLAMIYFTTDNPAQLLDLMRSSGVARLF